MTTLVEIAGFAVVHALGWTLLHLCCKGPLVAVVFVVHVGLLGGAVFADALCGSRALRWADDCAAAGDVCAPGMVGTSAGRVPIARRWRSSRGWFCG